MNVLVIGSGEAGQTEFVAGDSDRVWRYERESDRAAFAATRFDVAVLVAFSDELPRPVDLLREVGALLAERGRIVLHVSRVARAAVRAAVYRGSFGEVVAPVPSDEDVAIHGRSSLIALLDSAGFRTRDFGLSSATIEATVAASVDEDLHVSARASALPSIEERLALATRELHELREFFAELTEGQRTLQREAARLHRVIDDRDREIAALREEASRQRERERATVDAGARDVEAREEAARAASIIADLESRLARAIARDRHATDDQTSTE
jgi:hypothetical protein